MPAYSPEFKEAVITRMLPQRAGGSENQTTASTCGEWARYFGAYDCCPLQRNAGGQMCMTDRKCPERPAPRTYPMH